MGRQWGWHTDGLLLGRQSGELNAAVIVAPPLAVHGLLGAMEPGPHNAPGEPECPKGGREVHVTHHPGVPQLQMHEAWAEGADVEDVHEVQLQFAAAQRRGYPTATRVAGPVERRVRQAATASKKRTPSPR